MRRGAGALANQTPSQWTRLMNTRKNALNAPLEHTRHFCSWTRLLNWVRMGRFYNRAALVHQRATWKAAGQTVVFTNGCYDLLHPGHVRLLEQARSMGDVLILALNSDAGVRRIKGPSRPLINETERAEMVLALEAVDAVTLFDEPTPRELIAEVLPDVLLKGADWSHFVAGREEVEAAGGRVLTIALEPGYSTTNLVERILSQP
jgi:rfaE bifunctional protein nucleotidyltransferase chain/domain